jgi:hypothetical protein
MPTGTTLGLGLCGDLRDGQESLERLRVLDPQGS